MLIDLQNALEDAWWGVRRWCRSIRLPRSAAIALVLAVTISRPVSAVMIAVDPDGDGVEGGMIAGGRVGNDTSTAATGALSVATFVAQTLGAGPLYIGFSMQSVFSGDGFFHGFETHDSPSLSDQDRNILIGDETVISSSNLVLWLNGGADTGEPTIDTPTSLGQGPQSHRYILKIEAGAGNNDDSYSLFIDPTSPDEGSVVVDIAGLSGTDTNAIYNVGFGSFVGNPQVIYSNVFLADNFAQVAAELIPPVNGDADGDGDIDGLDIIIAIENYTGSLPAGVGDKTLANGDTDGDGDVDETDFMNQINAYTSPGSGAQSESNPLTAPEPASCLAMLVLICPVLRRCRMR